MKATGAIGTAFVTMARGAAQLAALPTGPGHCPPAASRGAERPKGLEGAGMERGLPAARPPTARPGQPRQSGLRDAETHHGISCPRSSVTVSFPPRPEIEAEKLKVSRNYIKPLNFYYCWWDISTASRQLVLSATMTSGQSSPCPLLSHHHML